MPTYIAFLRAINLGAARRFPKDDIRRAVESAGFGDVETHINTGNVRFTTRMRSRQRIEATLEAAFLADRGFQVPTIAYTRVELAAIAGDAASLAAEHPEAQRRYVDLLRAEPTADAAARIEAASSDVVRLVVRGRGGAHPPQTGSGHRGSGRTGHREASRCVDESQRHRDRSGRPAVVLSRPLRDPVVCGGVAEDQARSVPL